jgi:hypothetical protein
VGTSTVRFAIIIALVVGGVLVLDQAFPESATDTAAQPSPTASSSASPSESPSPTGQAGGGDGQTEEPATKVVVGVYNGTFEDGLAGSVAEQLKKSDGYRVPDSAVGNTPARPQSTTTIYYRTGDDKASADALVEDFFAKKGLSEVATKLMQPDLDVPASLDLAIWLGTDYQNL